MSTLSGVSSSFPLTSSSASTESVSLTDPAQRIKTFFESSPASIVTSVVGTVAISAFAGALFSSVGAIGGAAFGMAGLAGRVTVEWLCDRFDLSRFGAVGEVAKVALPWMASIGAGCAALSAAGFTWAPGTVIALELGVLGVAVGAALTPLCCAGLAAIVAIGVAAANDGSGVSSARV